MTLNQRDKLKQNLTYFATDMAKVHNNFDNQTFLQIEGDLRPEFMWRLIRNIKNKVKNKLEQCQ